MSQQERDATDAQKVETNKARDEFVELISRAFQEADPRVFPLLAGGYVRPSYDYNGLEIYDKGRYQGWALELLRLPTRPPA